MKILCFLCCLFGFSLAFSAGNTQLCGVDSDCKICKNHAQHKCNQRTFKCECIKSKADKNHATPDKSARTFCNVDSDCDICKHKKQHKCNQMTFKCECVSVVKKTPAQIQGATGNMLAN